MSLRNRQHTAPVEEVKNALLQQYAYIFNDIATPENCVDVTPITAVDDDMWRTHFEVETEAKCISGAVFKRSDGHHYIDDDRNAGGTSVYQNIDDLFH